MNAVVIPIVPVPSAGTELPPGAQRQRRRQAPKGRGVSPQHRDEVAALIGPGPHRRELLIEHLHTLQDHFGQLATPHLAALAALMRLSQAEVYEVASFYHHFDIVREDAEGRVPAAPALTVRVCNSLACEMAGARDLLQRLPALLGPGVRVIPAPCVGRCDTAPVAVVHQRPVPGATAEAVQAAAHAALAQGERADHFKPQQDFAAYRALGGYTAWAGCVAGEHAADALITQLETAGLRGLGGAGFPAGRKWRIVRAQAAPRLMAVNLDEGEPGTFKDRWMLEREPHRFLEGLLIAAWAVDVAGVTVYLRDEYHGLRAMLQRELAALRAASAAGELPPLPPIELRRGAGAYICGEESAMLESIEGRRGLPRLRPPYVAERGLFGRPTLVHNGETLYWVARLLAEGPGAAERFASQGRHGRHGLRSFSVSGRVREPGVKLAPAGITLRELVDEYCGGMADGHTLYGYLPGGASGGILPASLADVPLDFDTLQPHGAFIGSAAVIVLGQHDRAVDAARNVMRFFEHESCGQCTPCRAGTAQASRLMAGETWPAELLAELGTVMREASICGLGQAAPNAFDSVLRHFPQELVR